MGFGEAVSTCFSKYVDFNGRAMRSEYWFWQLFVWLVMVGLLAIVAVMGNVSGRGSVAQGIVMGCFGLFFLGIFLPGLAVLVRRLHDINCSGWLVLLGLIPYLGGLALFVMSVLPGTKGSNTYGPDARPESVAAVF
jgi:uncharacterized membrane protein YhaH (DUF805 family)